MYIKIHELNTIFCSCHDSSCSNKLPHVILCKGIHTLCYLYLYIYPADCLTCWSLHGGLSSLISQTTHGGKTSPSTSEWSPSGLRELDLPMNGTEWSATLAAEWKQNRSDTLICHVDDTHHCVAAIICQNNNINGCSVISNTYSSFLWLIFSGKQRGHCISMSWKHFVMVCETE